MMAKIDWNDFVVVDTIELTAEDEMPVGGSIPPPQPYILPPSIPVSNPVPPPIPTPYDEDVEMEDDMEDMY